jgi:hypothetical protein
VQITPSTCVVCAAPTSANGKLSKRRPQQMNQQMERPVEAASKVFVEVE